MADLKVNTDAVVSFSDSLTKKNERIDEDFKKVINSVEWLKGTWKSPAADRAFEVFSEIKNTICEPRSAVMKNYANYLKVCVGEGYEAAEKASTSLADAFK